MQGNAAAAECDRTTPHIRANSVHLIVIFFVSEENYVLIKFLADSVSNIIPLIWRHTDKR